MSAMNDLIRGRLARATDQPRVGADTEAGFRSIDRKLRPNHGTADAGVGDPVPGPTDMNQLFRQI